MKKEKILNLFVGSNNQGKIKEIRGLLPKKIEILTPKDFNLKSPNENGKTFEQNSFIKAKFFEGLAHALTHLIYDGDNIIGYITDEGPVLSQNEFDSHLIPRDFFRILKNRIKESGMFFYDLVPHNIILKDG